MLSSALTWLRNYDWAFRRRGREAGPVLLTHRRVFILPTRQGLLFGLFLALMLLGSVNYNLSLGYVLVFLLATTAMVSILHSFRNLAHLRISAERTPPVFAGDSAIFPIRIESPDARPRWSIGVAHRDRPPVYGDVGPGGQGVLLLRVEATRRGWVRPGPLRIFTRFPLGLVHAWSNVELDAKALAYPKPDGARLPLPSLEPKTGAGVESGTGEEDFLGLRPYRPGDSPRQIAWKAVARERGVPVKVFSGLAEAELWLDWDLMPGMETEARLARLTRWVLAAEAAGLHYGLRLPGLTLPPGRGATQREECLRALALHGLDGGPA